MKEFYREKTARRRLVQKNALRHSFSHPFTIILAFRIRVTNRGGKRTRQPHFRRYINVYGYLANFPIGCRSAEWHPL